MAGEPMKKAPGGFEGEIAGFSLADVLQLNMHNRFSGCVHVQYEECEGLVFLREGEIIHAEQGDKRGEDAFYDIMAWPGGRFALQANLATTQRTIQKSAEFLLIEAHRLMDERRAGLRPPSSPAQPRKGAGAKPGAGKPLTATAMLERLRGIPGVAYAVLQAKDGTRLGDKSYEAEVLAGQVQYLAMMGRQLGAVFGASDVTVASVEGKERHLLFFATKNHVLSFFLNPDAQVGAVEAEVRAVLASIR